MVCSGVVRLGEVRSGKVWYGEEEVKVIKTLNAPQDKGQMEKRGLLLDQNLKWAIGQQGWLIIR